MSTEDSALTWAYGYDAGRDAALEHRVYRPAGDAGYREGYTQGYNAMTYVEPLPLEELAELNPGLDQRGLRRLQAFEQLLAEDDARTGYQDPED